MIIIVFLNCVFISLLSLLLQRNDFFSFFYKKRFCFAKIKLNCCLIVTENTFNDNYNLIREIKRNKNFHIAMCNIFFSMLGYDTTKPLIYLIKKYTKKYNYMFCCERRKFFR